MYDDLIYWDLLARWLDVEFYQRQNVIDTRELR